MIYRWSIDDLPMIEPCFGMNGHPIARMDTILRQCEAEVKIFNSRWFPASIYRSKWSIIAGQGSNMKKMSKKTIFSIFFWNFISIQGVQEAIREGPEPIQELKNYQIYWFFNFFQKSMKNWFDPINGDNFLRWFSLSRLELRISEFSKKSKNFENYKNTYFYVREH